MPEAASDPNQNQNNASLEALLRENLELTRQIYALSEKTRRYIFYSQVLGIVKIVLVVGPLVVGALYLGPLLKQALGAYGESFPAAVDPGNILEQLKNLQQ